MDALIPQLIAAIPTAALPLVFVIVACWFIYWKIQSQRKETKKERDEAHDNLVTRVTLLEHDVEFMKQQNSIFGQKLDRILDELSEIKVTLATKQDKK
jgi:LPS sulfotransferase NodH